MGLNENSVILTYGSKWMHVTSVCINDSPSDVPKACKKHKIDADVDLEPFSYVIKGTTYENIEPKKSNAILELRLIIPNNKTNQVFNSLDYVNGTNESLLLSLRELGVPVREHEEERRRLLPID